MYKLHYWPTPNGHKITLFFEELGLPYEISPVDFRIGAQFEPDYLKISPNNKMPALEDGETGVHLFESGAILLYLADKHQAFIPPASRAQGRAEVLQWLMWQMSGLGPMMGQAGHFRIYAPEKVPYGVERYTNETLRLLAVMDKRLSDRAFLAGPDYSIADMASYPWAMFAKRLLGEQYDFAHIDRWVAEIAARPATIRAYALAEDERFKAIEVTQEQRDLLFKQGRNSIK